MEKYIALAERLHMKNALTLSPQDIFFDIRAILKCRFPILKKLRRAF